MSLIVSILGFGIIVMIHEFGHFILAKSLGVGVIEFSIGMGPRLFSFVKGETRYSFRVLPFGGSCMMLGEEAAENGGSDGMITVDGRSFSRDRQFANKPAWKRLAVILAGPFFNFILAFLLSLAVTGIGGWDRPVILAVTEGSPAQEAGLSAGDTVTMLEIRGRKTRVKTSGDIQLFFLANGKLAEQGEEIGIRFKDASGQEQSRRVVLRYNEEEGRYLLGISYSTVYEPCENLGQLLEMSLHNLTFCLQNTVESLRMMIRGELNTSDVKGVVGIVAVMDETMDEAYDYGFLSAALTFMNFMMLLSFSVGIMNLIPLPALDGGRIFFILIEMITGKGVPKKAEAIIHTIGFVILMGLMVLILFNDVWNLIK